MFPQLRLFTLTFLAKDLIILDPFHVVLKNFLRSSRKSSNRFHCIKDNWYGPCHRHLLRRTHNALREEICMPICIFLSAVPNPRLNLKRATPNVQQQTLTGTNQKNAEPQKETRPTRQDEDPIRKKVTKNCIN